MIVDTKASNWVKKYGIDEHHPYMISDKTVSYYDLQDAYIELLDKKTYMKRNMWLRLSRDMERLLLLMIIQPKGWSRI